MNLFELPISVVCNSLLLCICRSALSRLRREVMATLDDKILGEKRHYYCSSSSDEDDSDDDKDKGKDGSCATVTDADNGTLDQQQPRFFDSSGAVNVSSYLCRYLQSIA